MDKQLSVVVACHDIEEFLPACLDSLSQQTLPPAQVILVNDGSTDRTGSICRAYAETRPGWQVVEGPGAGPGGARNLGLEHVTGDYLAFVDGDDVVPPDAYRILVQTLEQTGSDFAVGDVQRYDGIHLRPSGPHRNAILSTKLRTTIRRTAGLVYDTTAWNKVFRTRFWRAHDLRFRPGVTYEDLPVMIAAHVAADSVDVIKQPVYWWRRRIDADASITQRRGEVANLRDRMDAIDAIDALLADEPVLKRRHDRKVLTFDVPLYLPFVAGAGDEYQQLFLRRVGDFVGRADPKVVAGLPPRERLRYWLIEQGRMADLLVLLESDRDPRGGRRNIVRDGQTYAWLPFLDEPGYPPELFRWGATHPVATAVEDLSWRGFTSLRVSGFAHLVGVDAGGRRERQVEVRWRGKTTDVACKVQTVERPDLTAAENAYDADYDRSGLEFDVDVSGFADDETVKCEVTVVAPGGRRTVALSGAFDGRANLPARQVLPDGRVAVVRWREEALHVLVQRPPALVTDVRLTDAGEIDIGFQILQPGWALHVQRRDSVHDHTFELAERVVVPLAAFAGDSGLKQLDLDFTLRNGGRSVPALMSPGVPEAVRQDAGTEYWARPSIAGALLVSSRAARPWIHSWELTADALVIQGDHGESMDELVLEHRMGHRSHYRVHREGQKWTARLPVSDEASSDGVRHLVAGRWSLLAGEGPVQVAEPLRRATTPDGFRDARGVRLQVRARRNGTSYLHVDPSGREYPGGLRGRRELSESYYPRRRRRRLQDVILFENWKGKQYSDNLAAIDRELERRGDRRERVWVVRNRGIRVPQGTRTVMRFSREYFDLLARARWIVANDAIDGSYVKRDDQVYLQTWHGTPLKKVGFDIGTVNFANRNYLDGFALEVAKWDYLVSPNPYSSRILPAAFHYEGKVLDTGYPRNDLFYRPEREQRAAWVRRRLGLDPGRKVILYAPTWRDDRYDDQGRYIFDLKLNVDLLREAVGGDHVLLLRGHHLLASRAGTHMAGDFVRNVSTYPDIADLYLIADVLVTDYSSVMFDFANTGRPILFYAWDLADYRDQVRGMYFDLAERAPGPVLSTTEHVLEALLQLPDVAQQYAPALQRFREEFCGWEDGNSAARVVDAALQR